MDLRPRAFKILHAYMRWHLKKDGFEWELRHFGDSVLGFWRRKDPKRKGKKLLLIPGFGDTGISWLGVLKAISPFLKSEISEWILLDIPGFQGFLAEKPCFPSFEALLMAIRDVFKELDPDTILCHSLGGWLAAYAAQEGKRERDFILVCPAGVFEDDADRDSWRQIFEAAIRYGYKELRPRIFRREPFWFFLFTRELESFIQRPDTVQFMRSIVRKYEVGPLLPSFKGKLHLIWGQEDRLTPSRWMESWLKNLPKEAQGFSVKIPKCGHSPQIEHPFKVGGLILQIILQSRVILPELKSLTLLERSAVWAMKKWGPPLLK